MPFRFFGVFSLPVIIEFFFIIVVYLRFSVLPDFGCQNLYNIWPQFQFNKKAIYAPSSQIVISITIIYVYDQNATLIITRSKYLLFN